MENFTRFLKQHPFIKGFDKAHVQLMVGCAKNAVFQPSEFLFREGQPANEFYIIRQGKVSLETLVPGGKEQKLQTINEGEVLGWSWLFPPFRWHFDAKAEDKVRAFVFDGKCLRKKCQEDPAFGFLMMQKLAQIMMKRLQQVRLQYLDVYGENK